MELLSSLETAGACQRSAINITIEKSRSAAPALCMTSVNLKPRISSTPRKKRSRLYRILCVIELILKNARYSILRLALLDHLRTAAQIGASQLNCCSASGGSPRANEKAMLKKFQRAAHGWGPSMSAAPESQGCRTSVYALSTRESDQTPAGSVNLTALPRKRNAPSRRRAISSRCREKTLIMYSPTFPRTSRKC